MAMEKTYSDLVSSETYTKQNIRDNTLGNAQLVARCPLDNGRYTDASTPAHYSAGKLDQLPAELLIQVLLYTDVPSLTRFRRVNRRAMQLVDSVPQYATIIKHCPDIIRAIVSIQADAFDCNALYATLSAPPGALRASALTTISTSSTATEFATSASRDA